MKKLLALMLGAIWAVSVCEARISPIETYHGITIDYAKAAPSCASKYTKTCSTPYKGKGASCGGLFEACECKREFNVTCSSPYFGDGTGCTLGGTTKYKSCKCPATYTKTCSSPYEGTTAACNGKYTACKCKSEYTKTCTGEGEEGFGTSCNSKYASCQCKSSYKTCASGYRGVGSACTADGGEKYTSCVENCSSAYRYTCEGVTQIGSGDSCGGKYKACLSRTIGKLYNGKGYTDAIVKTLGNKGLMAYAASRFYAPGVSKTDAQFGQGHWYMPALGEMMEMYGYNTKDFLEKIAGRYDGLQNFSRSYTVGDHLTAINETLNNLAAAGVAAEPLAKHYYTSSLGNGGAVRLNVDDAGLITNYWRTYSDHTMRVSNMLSVDEDTKPKIGWIMYADGSCSDVSKYESAKTVVGVVYWADTDSDLVRIVNLKDLTFSNTTSTGNFNEDNPYGGSTKYSYWCTSSEDQTQIPEIPFIYDDDNGEYTVKAEVAGWWPFWTYE